MNKKLPLLLSLISLFSVVLLSAPTMAQTERIAAVTENDRAVNFTLQDLDGRSVKLSRYKGRVVLLYFMASWCPECPANIPDLKTIHARYGAKGLVLMNVDVQETRKKALAFSNKFSLPYPTLLDEDGQVSRSFGVFGVPVKVLIDRKGKIICWNCRSLEKKLEEQFRP
jgi:peroxiredoxin